MSWRVRHSRALLKELSRLPENVRTRVEAIAFGQEIREDPYLSGKSQKLTGYQIYYKIRIGDYRIGLRIVAQDNVVDFLHVLHRRDIYRKFPGAS